DRQGRRYLIFFARLVASSFARLVAAPCAPFFLLIASSLRSSLFVVQNGAAHPRADAAASSLRSSLFVVQNGAAQPRADAAASSLRFSLFVVQNGAAQPRADAGPSWVRSSREPSWSLHNCPGQPCGQRVFYAQRGAELLPQRPRQRGITQVRR
ncbi:hypothetical protein, partial [Gordonia sp. 852002-10350_SCH5691597]|uniref:hypothetical protein n=1 Tax=Gordonia sp. 852002-10350_SCH5691597 TaxID=1834085 RepID=UPI001E32D9FC